MPHRRALGIGLVALTLVAGAGLYLQLEKQVTLIVDGEAATVKTFSTSVGQFLGRQDITIGEHDKVRPGLDAGLEDGMTIRVEVAKEINLLLNGESRTLYVTGKTVDEVLEQVNFRSGNKAYVRPSRSSRVEDGDTIVLREAVSVRVRVDGTDKEIITNAPDVGYLLVSMGVILRKQDLITPDPGAELSNGLEIAVTRVRFKSVTERTEIAYGTQVKETDALIRGQRGVEREGTVGIEEARYRVRLEDGKETQRTLLEREVVREPVDRIELLGTRAPNIETGIASWYHRTGMVAAHKTLPFGTQVKVTNLATGKTVTVTINDRGPYIEGRIIDLSDDAFAQLASLGSGTINVRIAW